jgi:hypothetical protein
LGPPGRPRTWYHLIPIRLGVKATVGALRGGLRVPRPHQFWTRRRVAWYSLILIKLSVKAVVGKPPGVKYEYY